MPRILESEALALAQNIDSLDDTQKPQALDILTRYKQQQDDFGEPEWPTQSRQREGEELRFRSMFEDLANVDKAAPSLVETLQYSDNPDADRARVASIAYLSRHYGKDSEEIGGNLDLYKNDFATKRGTKGNLDDLAFYRLAASDVAETKLAEDTRLEGAKAALRGEDVIGSLQAWQGKNLDRLAGSTDFTKGYLKAKDQAGDYLPMADELLKLMESQTGQSNSAQTFDTKAASRLDELAVELAGMKPRERKLVYASLAARSEMAGYEQKRFWSQMLGELDKGLLRMSSTVGTTAGNAADVMRNFPAMLAEGATGNRDFGMKPGEVANTDETIAQRQALGEIHDELASIVSGTVDPVRPTIGWLNDTVETGLIKGPGAVAPFMAASALLGPYGAGLLFTADFAEQNRRDLRAAGMDNDRAIQIGTVAAPLQAAVESLSNMLQLGRFTKLQSVLANFTQPIGGGAGLALRYAQNTGISLAAEFTEEQLQDNFIVPAVQEIVGALASDVPEVDWSFYKTRAAESTPELLAVLVPMALVFGGVMTDDQVNLSGWMTSNIAALKELNYSEAQATEIVAEKTVKRRIAKASSMWRVRAGDKTTLEEGARSLSERMRQLSGDVVAQQQELERRGILPRMLRATEDQWRLTFQDGSTAAYNSHAEADAARWTWTEDQLGKVHALTRETLSSMERNLDVKREIGVEFSPDARTAQDAVNDGISVEQMSRRVKQGAALGDVAPDTAFDDAQAIDKATADSEGFLSSLRILGSSRNEFKDGVLRTTIRLWEGSNVLTLVEEKLEGDAKAIISERRGRDWMLSRLRAYEETSGDKLFRDVPDEQLKDDDIIEAWSHLGQSYLVGRSTFGEPLQAKTMRRFGRLLMRAGFTGAMNSEASFFAAVASRAKKLGELQKAGKLGADLTAELEKQLGIDSQVAHEAGTEAEARQFIDTSGYSEETPGPNGETFSIRQLSDSFQEAGKFYRIVHGEEAFRDVIDSGMVRTNATAKAVPGASLMDRLKARPTAFPSFSKDYAAMHYAQSAANHFIIVTEDASLQPSTHGRHSKGKTYFPTNEQGEHLSALPADKVDIFRHIGDGMYQLAFSRGKVVSDETFSSNTPGPNGETFSTALQKRGGVPFKAEQDAEYLAAVQAGDMETAQRMVDEAAKAAGVGNPMPIPNADLLTAPVFWRLQHPNWALNPDFKSSNQNDSNQEESGLSVWSSLRELLENQSGGLADYARGEVEIVAIHGEAVGVGIDGEPVIRPAAEAARFRHSNLDDYLRSDTLYSAREMAENVSDLESIDEFVDEPWGWTRVEELPMEFDPVTRDEAGNVIPLSQRFNPADNRITYSIASGDFAARMAAMFSPFQRSPELRMAIALVAKERVFKVIPQLLELRGELNANAKERADIEIRFSEEMAMLRADFEADEKQVRDERDFELKAVSQDKGSELDRERLRRIADKKLARLRLDYERTAAEAEKRKASELSKFDKKDNRAQRDRIKQLLRVHDALLSAIPTEVRPQVGGYARIAELNTDEKAIAFLEDRVQKMEKVLEKWLKKEYLQRIAKLFKRFAPKKDDKGRITSNITAEAAEDIGFAFDFASLDDANQEKEMGSVEKTLEESEDAAEIQDAIGKLAIFQLFHNLEKRESSELEAAAMWLDELGSGAREARKIIDAARAEQVKAAKDIAKADASNGKLSSLPDAENVEADVRSSTFKRFTNDVKGFLNSALFTMGHQLEIVFGQDSRITTEFHRRAVRAANDSTDIKRDIEARRAAFVADLFGTTSRIKQAGRMGALTVPTASGVIIETGGKTKTIDVPAEIVVRIIEGTADLKALGFTSEEASTLADAWADNGALPVKRQKRVFQIERRSDGKDVELTMSQDEAIQYLLWSSQKASREQMERDGWSAESFQQLSAFLSDDAKALAKFFAEEYARMGRLIEPVYRRMFHAPFPQVDNYSPIFRDISKADSIIDIDQQGHGSGVSSGFILARNKNARSALRRTSAFSAFMQHAESASHWIAHVELVRDLRSVLIDKEVQNAIRSSGRTAAANGIKKRVMQLENQGKVGAAGIAELDSWGSRLLQARAFKGLAWRISPVMKQASAYFNPLLADVPAWDYMRGTARLLSGQLDVSAMWNSPDIQRRIVMGFSAEARIAMDKLGYTGSTLLAAMGKGMLPMQLMDAGWTTAGAAVAFDYYRRNNIKSGMNEAQAESAALDQLEMMIAESAQPADPANRSLIEGLQNPWLKSMWMFSSESRKTLAVEIMALRRLATGKSKNKAMDVQRAVVAHVIMATTTQLMAGVLSLLMGDDDDREREWSVEEWVAAIAAGPINGLFLFGDAFNYIGRRLFGLHAFEPLTAIGQAVKTVSSTPSNIDKVINGEPEEQRKAFLKLGEAVGQAASIVGPGNPFTAADVILGNPLKDADKILARLTD